MKRIVTTIVSGLLASVLSCAAVWAQGTAQISGTVKDQSGAVLPGVEVTATQTGTGIARNTITNETGSYVLPNLAVGPYSVPIRWMRLCLASALTSKPELCCRLAAIP